MAVRLDQLNIVISDMSRSLAFYRRLGVESGAPWERPDGAAHANGTAGSMGVDFDTASFAEIWNTGWAGRTDLAGKIVVGFRTETREEVDALYASLTAEGHPGLQPPFDAFWGARYAIVADPDGIAVGLMSPSDPARRTPPPS